MPWEWAPRSLVPFPFDAYAFSNGTVLANGVYRLLTYALQPFGNPKEGKDWNTALSVYFNIEASS